MKTKNQTRLFIAAASIVFVVFFLMSCTKGASQKSGFIEYTFKGTTYKQTDNISALILDGEFAGITDDNMEAKVGDGEEMNTASGTTKTGCYLFFKHDGVAYGSSKAVNEITITSYDGTTIKGTFKGSIGYDIQLSSSFSPISGTFETSNLTKL